VGLRTRLTELLGCSVPIQQAGMGWIAGIDLAVAVADAGAVGMVAFPLAPPPVLVGLLDEVRRRTVRPVGLNIVVPFLDDEECVDIGAQRLDLVEFFWSDPAAWLVERVHAGGARAAWQVGSVSEARAAADAGCDLVIVQGSEAGGHVRGTRALLPLPADVLHAVDVPVLAAGGIATARSLAAVLAAGAAGARLGTRFVATPEADAHPHYQRALVEAAATDTVLTTQFATMWPDAPHRVLASCIQRARELDDEIAGHAVLAGMTVPVPAFSPISPTRTTAGRIEAMAFYAGEGVGAVSRITPAADVVRELAAGAETLLRRSAQLPDQTST
jgi:nitronate monooxygenase